MEKKKRTFRDLCKQGWNYFTTYEKIWFFSILILAIVFTFLFPETDDPTYDVTLNLSSASGAEYRTLDFAGTTGDFVWMSVTIDGKEYSAKELTGSVEYTVAVADETTWRIALPVAVSAESEVTLSCYPDEDGEVHVSVAAEGASVACGTFAWEEGDFSAGSVTENQPKYRVSIPLLMALYLMDVILNVACELLISKQSKWNFIVSLGVEVVEIIICIVCVYRFATLATTLFFWIPCDIISFIVWNKHRDEEKQELTEVKTLKPWQDVLVVAAILVWTAGVGYLLTLIEIEGGIFANNVMLKNIVCYLDACASAVGMANGLFILFRYREQWIAWYICALLETIINVISGQYVLLVLKAGYFTNTTYGYIKWTKYIRSHEQTAQKNTKKLA